MATASSLTQNAITWTFDTDYTYGQYANGDYWVIAQGGTPKVTVSAIGHTNAAGTIANQVNSWINPRYDAEYAYAGAQQGQGFDSRVDRYVAGLNSQPSFELVAGDSVVSVISWTTPPHGDEGPFISDAAVLTCVDEAQPAGTMRPPYARLTRVPVSSTDTLRFNISQIDWSKLPSLTKPASTPVLATTLAKIAKVWIDTCEGYGNNSRTHPSNNMNYYSRDMAHDISEVACQLMLDYTQAQKEPLMYAFLQYGIDLYGLVTDNGRWRAGAGHGNARHFPITFAGYILNDATLLAVSLTWTHITAQVLYRFGEDGQTYYYNDATLPEYVRAIDSKIVGAPGAGIFACRGSKGWMDIVNGGTGDLVLWREEDLTNTNVDFRGQEYLDCNEWYDGANTQMWMESYRRCCSVQSWIGYYLVAKIFGSTFKTHYGHNEWYDYCERWMTQDDTASLAKIRTKFPGGLPGCQLQMATAVTFINDMWADYRNYTFAPGPWVMMYG